nr:cupin domain-containing protein [uncultured Porphyromonas sp.]
MLGQEISEFGHILSNDQLSVVHVDLPQGKKIAPHDHKGQDIFFSVVKGQVKATLNGSEEHTLSPGTLLRFDGDVFIGIEALVDSEFFVYLINL